MDKNKKNKVKDFFRKEGFYLVLLVCLCVVAIIAGFTIKKNSVAKNQNKTSDELSLNDIQNSNFSNVDSNVNKQNAERVENNDKLANANDKEEIQNDITNNTNEEISDDKEQASQDNNSNQEDDVNVSSGNDSNVSLAFPIDGEVAISREFGKMIRVYSDENKTEDVSRKGIDINAAVGTVVKSAAEGKVEEVSSNTTDGTFVVIAHANGLKTKYSNLSEDVKVSVGDVVNTGTEIGTVGNTSGVFTSKLCGDVLNVQIEDINGKDVDPSTYFTTN